MVEDKICEKSIKCPIYTGVLASNEVLIQSFKHLYCERGVAGREKCKRYQVAIRAGSCPHNILPNSKMSVENIIKGMEQQK